MTQTQGGPALSGGNDKLRVLNCLLIDNIADYGGGYGGAFAGQTFISCGFVNNMGSIRGGAISGYQLFAHSDRGGQYASKEFRKLPTKYNCRQSMTGLAYQSG